MLNQQNYTFRTLSRARLWAQVRLGLVLVNQ